MPLTMSLTQAGETVTGQVTHGTTQHATFTVPIDVAGAITASSAPVSPPFGHAIDVSWRMSEETDGRITGTGT